MSTTTTAARLSEAATKLRSRFLSYLPFKAFLWLKIPLAGFAGLRIRACDPDVCEVSVPFGWRSQNPFGSLYFAAHAMAAEMSTGALVLLHAANHPEASLSTLITKMEAAYGKAAKSHTTYRCEAGAEVAAAVERAVATGEPVAIEVATKGTAEDGTPVGEFRFTWSVKKRAARESRAEGR
jgi:acyl-coenzyme A thioesterase PaaI-like protein